MSPARPGSSGGYLDDDPAHRRNQPLGAALGRDGDDEPDGTPDVFDAPLDELKATLSDMTKELGSLIDKDDTPGAPVAEQADIDLESNPESSGMSRLASFADEDAAAADAEPASAADRVALSLSIDDDADDAELDADATDEALDAPDMLGQQVLRANLDGDVNDNNIVDHFEDDLPADDDVDGDDDGGLEFASLDFDSD